MGVEMAGDAYHEHGDKPPVEVKEALDAGTEVLKQLLLAKCDVNALEGKGKGNGGLASFFEEKGGKGKGGPIMQATANMIREYAQDPAPEPKIIPAVAKALGFDEEKERAKKEEEESIR